MSAFFSICAHCHWNESRRRVPVLLRDTANQRQAIISEEHISTGGEHGLESQQGDGCRVQVFQWLHPEPTEISKVLC